MMGRFSIKYLYGLDHHPRRQERAVQESRVAGRGEVGVWWTVCLRAQSSAV